MEHNLGTACPGARLQRTALKSPLAPRARVHARRHDDPRARGPMRGYDRYVYAEGRADAQFQMNQVGSPTIARSLDPVRTPDDSLQPEPEPELESQPLCQSAAFEEGTAPPVSSRTPMNLIQRALHATMVLHHSPSVRF
jgi:hypothetical protein